MGPDVGDYGRRPAANRSTGSWSRTAIPTNRFATTTAVTVKNLCFFPFVSPASICIGGGADRGSSHSTGQVMFVSDGTAAWDFTADPDRPRCTELHQVHSPGAGRHLAITPRVEHWVGNHHSRPTGPVTGVEFLGRRCWSVDLAPRESRNLPKPSLRLVVDAETGAVLAQHSGDGIDGAAYTDLTVGEHLDPSLFTWDGPVVHRRRIEEPRRSRRVTNSAGAGVDELVS